MNFLLSISVVVRAGQPDPTAFAGLGSFPLQQNHLAMRNAGFVDYLEWELGLVAQLEREGHTGIRLID